MYTVDKIKTSANTYNILDKKARTSLTALRSRVTRLATDVQGIEYLLNLAIKELGAEPIVSQDILNAPDAEGLYVDNEIIYITKDFEYDVEVINNTITVG